MIKKMKNQKCYIKYIVKSPIVFFLFLLLGVFLFLYYSINLELNIIQSLRANIEDNNIIIEGEYYVQSDVIYLYVDRNERIQKLKFKQIVHTEGHTIFVTEDSIELSGEIIVDVVIDKQSLLKNIFIKAGKG